MIEKPGGFPNTYAKLEIPFLLEVYESGPHRLREAITGLDEADLKAHPVPNKWSIRQIVIHTSDSEVMGAARFRQTIAQPGSHYVVYDQDIWAEAFSYQEWSSEEQEIALKLLQALRAANLVVFKRATGQDWHKTGFHAEFGHLTLRQLLELYADHIERHLAQILERRELLGKPIEFPLLLPERLY